MKDLLSIDVLETFPRRGGKPFAQKDLAGCPNFYERVGEKGGPYYNNVGRTGTVSYTHLTLPTIYSV